MMPIFRPKKILFNHFVQLVEKNHAQITERFMNDLMKNPDTDAYRTLDRGLIYEHSDIVYRDLSTWISREYPKSKIAERYMKIGEDRWNRGIPFSQVQKALSLQMRHLWLFVMDKLFSDMTAYQDALELNNRVVLYFERAMFYVLKGYEKMIYKKL
jgi:hypothetical protein